MHLLITASVKVVPIPDHPTDRVAAGSTSMFVSFETKHDGKPGQVVVDGDDNPEVVKHALQPLLMLVQAAYPDMFVQPSAADTPAAE